MQESGTIFSYTGVVDYKKIDLLLKKLKKTDAFVSLPKTSGKRVYAIVVECLENIAKYSEDVKSLKADITAVLTVRKVRDKILIKSSNPIFAKDTDSITSKLNQINLLKGDDLTFLYEDTINQESIERTNGAGLGFMLMKMKSGNNLKYHFTDTGEKLLLFELEIVVNKYIMRKLIIDQTSSSPKVILDPDNKVFEISGESRPPDVGEFYGEILNWMDDYSHHLVKSHDPVEPVIFNFDLDYFNSSSAKYLLDLCKQIASVRAKGLDINVKWHYEDEDMDMLEVGREMSRMVKFPFEYVEK